MCWAPVHYTAEPHVRIGPTIVVTRVWSVAMDTPLEKVMCWRKGRRFWAFPMVDVVCWRKVSLRSMVILSWRIVSLLRIVDSLRYNYEGVFGRRLDVVGYREMSSDFPAG